MATMRREQKKVSRLKIARVQVSIFLLAILLIGVAIGVFIGNKFTKPEVRTVFQTIEVPCAADGLPEEVNVEYFDVPLSHSLQNYIYEICADENVPVTLVMAIIEKESQFDPEIISSTEDFGLMQINAINHEQLAEEYRSADMLNPYQNVFCGVKIISELINKYEGDYTKALMSYNMGNYGAQKAWENGIEDSSYSRDVLALYREYEEVLENATNADNE